MRITVMATMIVVLATTPAASQAADTPERQLSRATRNCTYAVVASLPKIPGIEIRATRPKISKFEPEKPREFDTPYFAGLIEVDTVVLGKPETFVAWCDHGVWSVLKVRDMSAYP